MVPSLRDIRCVEDLAGNPAQLQHVARRPEDIALLQYTSGSTGTPKGVILSHANLLANIRGASRGVQATGEDVFVSWLPLYHDMGLIGACLATLYNGIELVLMSPIRFLTRPQRWLWAIHRHRGTLSAAPNFAYELCLSKIDDKAIEGLDLGSWRLSLNGAEPVSPNAVESFCQRFAPYGFRRETMYPVYGLAENAVALAFPPPGASPRIDVVQREALARTGSALPARADDPTALRFVCCGRAIPEHEIRIVDATGVELGAREQGRIQFRGPSATSGYFNNPEATRRLFRGDWLETGDLRLRRRRRAVHHRPLEGHRDPPWPQHLPRRDRARGGRAHRRAARARGRVRQSGSGQRRRAPGRGGENCDPRHRVPASDCGRQINRDLQRGGGFPAGYRACWCRPERSSRPRAGNCVARRAARSSRRAHSSTSPRARGASSPACCWRRCRVSHSAARRNLGRWLYNGYAWSVFYVVHAVLWVAVMAWPGRVGRWRMAHRGAQAVLAARSGRPRVSSTPSACAAWRSRWSWSPTTAVTSTRC